MMLLLILNFQIIVRIFKWFSFTGFIIIKISAITFLLFLVSFHEYQILQHELTNTPNNIPLRICCIVVKNLLPVSEYKNNKFVINANIGTVNKNLLVNNAITSSPSLNSVLYVFR